MSIARSVGQAVLTALAKGGVETANAAAALSAVPESIAQEAIDGCDEDRDSSIDRVALLCMLASDRRASVRLRVAQVCATSTLAGSDDLLALLRLLAADRDSRVRAAAADSLSATLAEMRPVARIEVVATWALDEDAAVRAALASALPGPRGTIGVATALRHLSSDPSPLVRAKAAEARLR